jgi:CheY-like chemotaxis protein
MTKVLLVDDHPDIPEAMRTAMQSMGFSVITAKSFSVITAKNGKEGLRQLSKRNRT